MKKKILLGITGAEFLIMLLSIAAMDRPNITIPVVLLAQACGWVVLFAMANPEISA